MDSSIIILDSDDEDNQNQKNKSELQNVTTAPILVKKRPNDEHNGNDVSPPNKIRRIQPLKIGEVTSGASCSKDNDAEDDDSKKISQEETVVRNEETEELKLFIKACRRAENNDDMKKIIKKKLIKNYHLVSPSYVLSKNFQKMLKDTANDILRDPKRVYSKINDVVNELEARKRTKVELVEVPEEGTVAAPTASTSQISGESIEASSSIETTGDKKKDEHLKKLNKALGQLKKKIDDLEEAEVNLDEDDDSAYMQKVRYEKRAIEIYNKICELTEESSHAHRIVKKPIRFKDSKFKEFNKKLNKRVNRENGFPSCYDVYRILDYCNKEHKYHLSKIEIKDIAEAAFLKVGKLLKERRCSDLWESACYYLGENKDPAKEDQELKSKLEVNKEVYKKKTEEVLQYYTNKQYEESAKSNDHASTSTAVKEEEISEDILIEQSYEPSSSPPPPEMLIDVKAEELIEFDKSDDNNASVVNLSILS